RSLACQTARVRRVSGCQVQENANREREDEQHSDDDEAHARPARRRRRVTIAALQTFPVVGERNPPICPYLLEFLVAAGRTYLAYATLTHLLSFRLNLVTLAHPARLAGPISRGRREVRRGS